MKREAILSVSIAVLSLALFLPEDVRALQTNDSTAPQDAASTTEQAEATQMVPAEAVLAGPAVAATGNSGPGARVPAH